MDPNQPQPNLPADYLNQIAPQTPKKMPLNLSKKQLLVGGGLLAAILIVILLAVIINLTSNKKPFEQLVARLQSTATIVTNAQTDIHSSNLRALNSNLKIYLTNTNRDIAAPMLDVKIDVTKLDKDIVTSEAGTDITARLSDARLNAVYDTTYVREMSYRLDTIVNLMQQDYKSTGSTKLKSFLSSAYTNLQPIQKQFADFSDAND